MLSSVLALSFACTLASCSGHGRRAAGPAPEYERPAVPAWDAGKAVDPLEQAAAHGEAVTEPEAPPDAGTGADAAPRSPAADH